MPLSKRDRTALVLAVMLIPIMIFMLSKSLSQVSMRNKNKRKDTSVVVSTPPVTVPMVQATAGQQNVKGSETMLSVHTNVILEQQKVTDSLPVLNPFAPGIQAPTKKQGSLSKSVGWDVTGVMVMEKSKRRSAIINGVPLAVGEKLGEWKVVEINLRNVVLDNGSEKITLEVR